MRTLLALCAALVLAAPTYAVAQTPTPPEPIPTAAPASPVSPGATAKPTPKPTAVPTEAPPPGSPLVRLRRMQANEPVWVGDRLAYFGNVRSGDPTELFFWEPQRGGLGKATRYPAHREGLTASTNGRVAYVEHLSPGAVTPSGPDALMVYALGKAPPAAAYRGRIVSVPRWSPDGRRLAFIATSDAGETRLALLDATPGTKASAPTWIKMDRSYQLVGLVGWVDAGHVLMRVQVPLAGGSMTPAMLIVGKQGWKPVPPGVDPILSPDGRYLLDRPSPSDGDRRVVVRPLAGGPTILSEAASAFAWGVRADRVFLAKDGSVMAVDTRGKVIRKWPAIAAIGIADMVASPDGRYLACVADLSLVVIAVR